MAEGVGVSDEQLDEIGLRAIEGSDHMRMAGQFGHDPDGWFRGTVRELVGEVRASRAALARITGIDRNGDMPRYLEAVERMHTARAERDVLQQRIDKAADVLGLIHASLCMLVMDTPEQQALHDRQMEILDRVRAALTGTGGTE